MSINAFQKLEGTDAQDLIERLNKSWRGSAFDAKRTTVHAKTLSFMDKWVLAEAVDAANIPEKKCACIDNGKECVPIEFNADFVPELIKKNGIVLSRDSAGDYLRFWFEYARIGSDRLMLVEAIDDMPWREDPTPQARKSLAKTVTPLTLIDTKPDVFAFKGCILFRDTLFSCTIDVHANGQVRIKNRETIVEGLTVSDPMTGF